MKKKEEKELREAFINVISLVVLTETAMGLEEGLGSASLERIEQIVFTLVNTDEFRALVKNWVIGYHLYRFQPPYGSNGWSWVAD